MIKKGNDFMNKYFFWLDDNRPIPNNFIEKLGKMNFEIVHCYSYDAIKNWLETLPQAESEIYISFDHDLGLGKTGYDVAKYIVENNINLKCYWIHSRNPVGERNIHELLRHYGYTRKYMWL